MEAIVRKRQVTAVLVNADVMGEDERQVKRKGKKRQWIERRKEKGLYHNTVRELRIEDISGYKEMLRMLRTNLHKTTLHRQGLGRYTIKI